MKPHASLMAHLIPLTLMALFLGGCGGGDDRDGRIVLRMNTDSIGSLLEISRELATEFEAETGIAVEFVIGPDSATDRLVEYQRFLGARSSNIDIYMIDVTWPGVLASHFMDLTDHINTGDFFPAMIENNTVNDRLVAVPYYSDAPMLYYREDLLEAAGFDAPPSTWTELETMATA
ncbi:MAG: extracellular solute-binding protein, partial [Candidatus Sumerlaeia bacterium]|nr:extracellular solute-binding protein [Candidatus Sumerlaeia bacterium]